MTIHHAFERPREQKLAHTTLAQTPMRDLTAQNFPSEEPFEEHVAQTRRHSKACTTLELVIEEAFTDVTVGGDQFVYFDHNDATKCLAPDIFVKLGTRVKDFDSWFTSQRGAPDLAVEVVSESDRMKLTWAQKFERYEACGVQELVQFDPQRDMTTRVWDRVDDKLVERAPDSTDTFECRTLGLYWTIEMDRDYGYQLRLCRDREGKDLLPTPQETVLHLAHQLADERAARSHAEHERRIAEQKQRDEAAARLLAEQKQRDAEQKLRDEAAARLLAEQKQREEVVARLLAEQKQREAEQKLRDEADVRARAEAEMEHLRAEISRMRSQLEQR